MTLYELLPPAGRKIVYVVYGIIGVLLTAAQTGFDAAEVGQPLWLVVAWPVYGTLGAGFGILAASNVATARHRADDVV